MQITKRKLHEDGSQVVTAEPQYMQLAVKSLIVAPEVQRELNTAFVREIVKGYRADSVGVLYVSRREDGTRVLIDGQHRHAALIALDKGDELVECKVYEGLPVEQEAALFRHLNFKLSVKPLDGFLVRLTEGEPVAVAIVKAVDDCGWKVSRSPGNGSIQAVRALERVYCGNSRFTDDANDYDRLRLVLQIITAAWSYDRDGVHESVLGGLGLVIMRFGSRMDVASLTNKLAKHAGGPAGLIGDAKGLRNTFGGNLANSVAEVIVERYNLSRRAENRLPSWRS